MSFGLSGRFPLIHVDYSQPLAVSQPAAEAGMSVSSSHGHFKAIMQVSPMALSR
jgi:hypothetical protein